MNLQQLKGYKGQLQATIELESAIFGYTSDKLRRVKNLIRGASKLDQEYAQILIFEGYLRATKESLDYVTLWEDLYPNTTMKDFSRLDEFNEKMFKTSTSIVKSIEEYLKTSRILRSIIQDDVEEFKDLLKNEDVHKRFILFNDQKNESPDHLNYIEFASYFGSYEICKFLLEAGAYPNYRCLSNSLKSGNMQCYKLFENQATDSEDLLEIAINYHRHEFVTILYDKCNIKTSYVQKAILNMNTAFLLKLVECEKDYEANEVDPLVASAMTGNATLLTQLLQCGLNVFVKDPDDNNILMISSLFGRRQIAKIVIKYFEVSEIEKATVVAINCAKENVALFMLKYLYSLGPSKYNPTGILLYHAVNANCPDIVDYICKFQPNYNYRNKDGYNVLDYSILIKKYKLTIIMLKNGADISLIQKYNLKEEPYCTIFADFIKDPEEEEESL